MEIPAEFRLSVYTTDENEGYLYAERLPVLPVPRVGERIHVPGTGYWVVKRVDWTLPSKYAVEPSMGIVLYVEWPKNSGYNRPTYTQENGWRR